MIYPTTRYRCSDKLDILYFRDDAAMDVVEDSCQARFTDNVQSIVTQGAQVRTPFLLR